MSKHIETFRAKHLREGETVVAAADGYIGKLFGSGKDKQQNGALIITNQKAVFYRKGIFGETLQTIPLNKVSSVEQKSMLGIKSIRIHTSHDELEFTSAGNLAAIAEALDAGR